MKTIQIVAGQEIRAMLRSKGFMISLVVMHRGTRRIRISHPN